MTLEKILNNPNTVVFLGAGASWDSGLPLGDAASNSIIQAAFDTLGMSGLWSDIETATEKAGQWPRFEVTVSTLAAYLPKAPQELLNSFVGIGLSSTHKITASCSSSNRIWLTTNFDDQIERALKQANHEVQVISSRQQMNYQLRDWLQASHLVVKLHGDALSENMRDDLGVGIEQILRAFPRTAEDAIVSLLMGRPILFVGYAGRDPDLLTLVNRIIEASPAVAWIGAGSATGTAKRLSESYEHVVYSGDGSPACFAALGSHPNTHPEVIPGEWERRIHDWCIRQDTDSLAQAIASLCLERNERRTRKTVLSIHRAIRNKAPKHQLWCLERRCELLLRSERPDDKEILFLENELELLSRNKSIPQKMRLKAIISMSSLYFRSGGIDKALHLLQSTIEEVDVNDNTSLIELMISLGTIQTYRGGNALDDARATLIRARDLADRCQDPILQANASQRLAVLLMRTNHEVEAVSELEAIGPIIREIGAPRRTMVWRVNLAEANRISRSFDTAIALNTETLQLARNYGDEEVVMNCGQNQGLCLLSVGDIIQANEAFRNSLLLAQERVGGECIGNALYNLGWLRVIIGMWSSARCWLKRAADEYAKYGARERCGGALALKAWCELRRGNLADVQVELQKIEQEQLIPSSFLSADLEMVKAAMSWLEDSILPGPGEVLARLGGRPEQIFYLLTWMIDERSDEYEGGIRQKMLQMAVEAVEESGLVAYYAILSDLIYRLGLNEPIALIKNIERRMPFNLSDIVQAVSRNDDIPNTS